jgi:hypothetical protein
METSNVIRMPIGSEVEAARLHIPTSGGGEHTSGLTRPSWREGLASIRSRGTARLMSTRDRVRSGLSGSIEKGQTHVRSHAAAYAGAAMGAGFALGLLGRLALWRKTHRSLPEVIVISEAC